MVQWLNEDAPSFDVGGAVVGSKPEVAQLLAKAPGVLAGTPFVNAVFHYLGCRYWGFPWKVLDLFLMCNWIKKCIAIYIANNNLNCC